LKKTEQRAANTEEKISKERDFVHAQAIIDFFDKKGASAFTIVVNKSLEKVFSLSMRRNLTKSEFKNPTRRISPWGLMYLH
jgi:hypothetical protein